MISIKFDCDKKRHCWSKNILQGACPCLPPTTVSAGARVFYRQHALAYPQPHFLLEREYITDSMPLLPPQTYFLLEREHITDSMPLITPKHTFCWSESILQGACPCLPPNILFVGARESYKQHALAYPQPHFLLEREYITDSMPLLPPQTYFLLEREHITDSMPLITPKHTFCWSESILQGACPCLPPNILFVGARESYKQHALAYPQPHFFLEREYFTGSILLLTPNHSYKTCGGPEAVTFSTIFLRYVVEKLSLEGRNATS